MDDLDNHALIKEWKKKIDAAAYEENLIQYVKKPSIKKKINRNEINKYWPTSIKESLNWLPFFDITELTVDRIDNDNFLTIIVKYVFNV